MVWSVVWSGVECGVECGVEWGVVVYAIAQHNSLHFSSLTYLIESKIANPAVTEPPGELMYNVIGLAGSTDSK